MSTRSEYQYNDFVIISEVYRSAGGAVYQVRHKKSGNLMVMKVLFILVLVLGKKRTRIGRK